MTTWNDRLQKEAREAQELADWASHSADSAGRAFEEPEDPLRTCYERDRDRITHSTAFRRLMYKTQVFVNHEGDHNRTRLSHSLEVCQVARSVGTALRLNEALCEALALSHDIGHPPFGHRGEMALDERMQDHGGFRHNHQVLRVVDRLERRSPDYPGLNLTREVRESLLKHEGEEDWPDEFRPRPKRPCLEGQVVDLADSTAYDKHDIEDGLLAGMFEESELLEGSSLWRAAHDRVGNRYEGFLEAKDDPKLRVQRIANEMIGACIHDLIEATRTRIEEVAPTKPTAVQAHDRNLVAHGSEIGAGVAELQSFLHRRFYRHEHLQRFLKFARSVLHALFDAYLAHPEELPDWYASWADQVGLERAICDYVAGMTDRFALQEHERLAGALPAGFSPRTGSWGPL